MLLKQNEVIEKPLPVARRKWQVYEAMIIVAKVLETDLAV